MPGDNRNPLFYQIYRSLYLLLLLLIFEPLSISNNVKIGICRKVADENGMNGAAKWEMMQLKEVNKSYNRKQRGKENSKYLISEI